MNTLKTGAEQLEEGWVKFVRYYCREGFIDRYMGDMNHNPNLESKPRMNLNAGANWVRLNGEGEWVRPHPGSSKAMSYLTDEEMRESFAAEELFKEFTTP